MGTVYQELSALGTPKSTSVTDEESSSENIVSSEESDDNAAINPFSRVESLESDEDHDEDSASLRISDEQYDEDSDPSNVNSQVSIEREFNNRSLFVTTPIHHSVPDKLLPQRDQDLTSSLQSYAKILGNLDSQFPKNITISDDQSAGSKIEERKLLALRGPANKGPERLYAGHSRLSAQAHQRAADEQAALQQAAHQQAAKKQAAHQQAAHQQAAHQQQLQIVRESQKRKEILVARQQQEVDEQNRSDFASDSAMMGVEATNSARREAISRTSNSNIIDDDTMKTNLQDILDGADPSQLDLQKLQEYIELLQVKAREYETVQKEKVPSRFQIIYRIKKMVTVHDRRESRTVERYLPFFDYPEWVEGQGTARRIQSNLPLNNFELYLEKNKDVAFIVYRNFDEDFSTIVAKPGSDLATSDAATHLPQYSSETIRPVNEDLIEAIKILLSSRQEYTEILSEFSRSYELAAPYLFIYHSRKSLEGFQNDLILPAKAQLHLLLEYITKEYADEYAAADSLLVQGRTSPGLVHYLFKPGDLLFSCVNGQYMGYVSTSWPMIHSKKEVTRMRANTSGNGTGLSLYDSQETGARMAADKLTIHVCKIRAWRWAFDGSFQRIHDSLELQLPAIEDRGNATDVKGKNAVATPGKENKPGLGERYISDLNVFPMQFASAELVEKCRQRGKTIWKCRTRKYVSYQDSEVESIQNLVDERYMVDLKTHRSLHPESSNGRNPLIDELGPEAMARDEPPDEQFELLLPLKIKGYNLRRKKWFDLLAERISDVKWNKEAFQNLVIDRKARDLIRALVSNQLAAEKGTDLIMGKGNGLILLLHGGPGTGKTLTAESVAEIAEKPLYRVTCGDVGTKAEDVEKYLESVLHLGKIWGCVVLLDEADVFLEQRSLEDMQRNALVSVFLRVLEYYEGILVLTSNRVGTFDEAFKSRIQLALHYPVLGPYQRLRIWENFLNRLESFDDDDKVDIADLRDHLEDLKEEKMNGRQIRNAITTARQYAEWKGKTLTYEHLSDVIEVSGRFDQYLDKLNGGFTQDQLAQDEGLRLA